MLLIADKNRTGVVDMPIERLASRAGLTLDQTNEALALLSAPDIESSSDEENGRRLVPIREESSRGWRLVNWQKYKDILTEEQRREQTRRRVAEHRKKNRVVTDGNADVTKSNPSYTDAASISTTKTLFGSTTPNEEIPSDSDIAKAAEEYNSIATQWARPKLTTRRLLKLTPSLLRVRKSIQSEHPEFTFAEALRRVREQESFFREWSGWDFAWFAGSKRGRYNAEKTWSRCYKQGEFRKPEQPQARTFVPAPKEAE